MKLQGKTALVTGADSGIGRATAELFAHEGADVCIGYHTDRDGADETKRRVEAAGRRALVVQCDVGDPQGLRMKSCAGPAWNFSAIQPGA